MRALRLFRACFVLALWLAAAVASGADVAPDTAATPTPTAVLPAVEPLAASPLPTMIAEVAPSSGESIDGGRQIRVRFRDDVAPLAMLDDPSRTSVLAHFSIFPRVPGQFQLLTPRLVVFMSEAPYPPATRIRVMIARGLRDLHGHQLDRDVAWTFETDGVGWGPPLPDDDDRDNFQPFPVQPTIALSAGMPVDIEMLRAKTTLVARNSGAAVGVRIEPDPQQPFVFNLTPVVALLPNTAYELSVAPGVPVFGANLPADGYKGRFHTYGPLHVVKVERFDDPYRSNDGRGRFRGGVPSIAFSQKLLGSSLATHVHVDLRPAPKHVAFVLGGDQQSIQLDPAMFSAGASASVTLDPEITDVFGQQLGRRVRVPVWVGHLSAAISTVGGDAVMPPGLSFPLEVRARNLPADAFMTRVRRLDPVSVAIDDVPAPNETSGPYPPDWLPRALSTSIDVEKVVPAFSADPLRGGFGAYIYGVSSPTNTYANGGPERTARPVFAGVRSRSNIALFVQMFSANAIVRTHRLSDGAPVVAARIAFFRALPAGSDPAAVRPCYSGTTDDSGTLIVGDALDACNGSPRGDAAALVVTAQAGDDWTFLRSGTDGPIAWNGGTVGVYRINAGDGTRAWPGNAAWRTSQSGRSPQLTGTMITDRDLYQAGDTVHAAIFAYRSAKGKLHADLEPLHVHLRLPSGEDRSIATVRATRDGTAAVAFPLGNDPREGGYNLTARADDGQEMQAWFQVAAVRVPLFGVKVTMDRPVGVAGDSVEAKAAATYLFGSPVNGVPVRFSVRRSPTCYQPKGWERWNFGPSAPGSPTTIGRTSYRNATSMVPLGIVRSRADGIAHYGVTVAAEPYAEFYEVEAETRDAANAAVAEHASFIGVPSAAAVGLRHEWRAITGTAFPVDVAVIDPAAHAIAGVAVHLTLQRFRIDPDLDPRDANAVDRHWEPQDERDVTSAPEPLGVSFTPRGDGRYRLTARSVDARGRAWITQSFFDAGGPIATPPPGRPQGLGIDGRADRRYHAGDTVRVHFWPRFADSDVLVGAIDRDGFTQAQRAVGSGERDFSFAVTEKSMGRLEAVEVRRGPLPAATDTEAPTSAVHTASFVFVDDSALQVAVTALPARTRPGKHVSLRVHVTDQHGSPQSASLTVAVVDRAALQLTHRNIQDLLPSLSARTQPWESGAADSADALELAPRPVPPLDFDDGRFNDPGLVNFIPGGGGDLCSQTMDVYSLSTIGRVTTRAAAAAPATPHFRRLFTPLAAFQTNLATDKDGFATVDVILPGNVTTWDVMVFAATAEGRTAEGLSSLQTTQPLVVTPSVPAFLRPGDRPLLGAIVSNRTGGDGPMRFFADVSRPLGLDGSLQKRTVAFAFGPAAGQTQAYRIGATALSVGTARLRLGVTLGTADDGIELPLPVRTTATTEHVTVTGRTGAAASVPIVARGLLRAMHGGLDLTLSSTLFPEILTPFTRARADDSPTGGSLAARIRIASDGVMLNETYRRPLDAAMARAELQTLLSALQPYGHDDGGYSDLPGSQWGSDAGVSVNVLGALARAKLVNAHDVLRLDALQRYVTAWLMQTPPPPHCSPYPWCTAQAAIGALLASGASVPPEALKGCEGPYEPRYDSAATARLLVRISQCRAEGISMRDRLIHRSRETSRSTLGGYQADFLALLAATHADPELVDRALTGLLATERDGSWGWVGNDADSLDAIADAAAGEGPLPDFSAQAAIGAVQLRTSFFGYRRTQFSHTIPLGALPRPSGDLALAKDGPGTLHYAATLRYDLYGAQAGRYAGLRVDRFVRLSNAQPIVAAFSLAVPGAAFTLTEGAVYDVEVRIVSDHDVDRVVLTDPLPAGVDPIDESLAIASQVDRSGGDRAGWGAWYWWRWWTPDYVSASRERVVAYFAHLPAGAHSIHYLVRVAVPGHFWWPGATARLERVPEDFGRSAAGYVDIAPAAGTHIIGGEQH